MLAYDPAPPRPDGQAPLTAIAFNYLTPGLHQSLTTVTQGLAFRKEIQSVSTSFRNGRKLSQRHISAVGRLSCMT